MLYKLEWSKEIKKKKKHILDILQKILLHYYLFYLNLPIINKKNKKL